MINERLMQININVIFQWALIFYFCTTLFRCLVHKIALRKIKSRLIEGETIVYSIKFGHGINFFLSILLGSFWGAFILPFFLYPEIDSIKTISRSQLPLLIVLEIFILLLLFIVASKKNVLTNYRILNAWAFKILDILGSATTSKSAMFKNIELEYNSIEHIKFRNEYGYKFIDIHLKNGNTFYIAEISEISKVNEKLTGLINRTVK